MAKQATTMYLEPNDAGKPCGTLPQLVRELAHRMDLGMVVGLTNRPGKNRHKVRITVTVEAVK